MVGGKADIDAGFCKFHELNALLVAIPRRAENSGRRYVSQTCATTMRWRRARRIALPCPTP